MLKRYILFLALTFLCGLALSAQDSVFVYRNGQIIYRSQSNQIDSLSLYASKYWNLKNSETIFESLHSDPDLHLFTRMLEIAGYRDKLNDKTIWAPVDSSLSDIDLNDKMQVRQIVQDHLSESIRRTFGQAYLQSSVRMINDKIISLTSTNTVYRLDQKRLLQLNKAVAGSLIHTMEGYIPYRYNLMEYLLGPEGPDYLKDFLKPYTMGSINKSTGDTVYSNSLFESMYASLGNEDKRYTLLLPEPSTWQAAADSLYRLYPPSDTLQRVKRMDDLQQWMLLHLVLNGDNRPPFKDSIYLSSKSIRLIKPVEKFGNAGLRATLTNGNCLNIEKLDGLLAPLRTIVTETEDTIGRSTMNTEIKTKNVPDTTLTPPWWSYSIATPLTTYSLSKAYVTYSLPYLFPGKYNIYAVLVPPCLEDSTNLRSNKLSFYLLYPGADGVSTVTSSVVSNYVFSSPTKAKILVKSGFQVDFLDNGVTPANRMYKLRIENTAKSNETTLYDRTIRTDCIIFEKTE